MKAHYYVAITVIVVLIGIGYGLTVWMHATLEGEHPSTAESGNLAATESSVQEVTTLVVSSPTAPTEQASSEIHGETGSAQVTPQAETTVTESSPNETAQTTPEIQNGEATGTASSASELTPVAEQTDGIDAVLITIEVKAVGQPIDLSGWRLSDSLGVAGHTDHVYYFGEQTLSAGQTLTVYSSCGRDQDLILYWCLSHPLTIVNSGQKELLLHNAQGELAATCTIADSSRAQVRYECA